MIKNVVFDVGKVLVAFEPIEMMKKLGFDKRTREVVFHAVFGSELWNINDKGTLTTEELTQGFIENAPEYENEIKLAFEHVGDSIEMFPFAMEWMEDLKAKGLHLYIISNYGQYTFEQTKQKLEFLPYMEGAIFSYQHKIIKPDLKIYEKLLTDYDLKAEECVFIDDRLENIEAAKKVGYVGIQFFGYEDAKVKLEAMLG